LAIVSSKQTTVRNVVAATVLLAVFAIIGTGLVAFTFQQTEPRIRQNEREELLRNLHQIIPPQSHDNNIFKDTTEVVAPQMLGTSEPVTVYRARKDGKPVAVAFTPIAPDGYNGAIKLLVGIKYDGTLAGVRVISQHETPGLGDGIETDRSNWILGFAGKSLGNPPLRRWAVKKDGGVFDQFTGATITPRAVVKAVRKSLLYFRAHRDELFEGEPARPTPASDTEDPATFPVGEDDER
jgi:electron transport complex protein RnfG